MSQNVQTKPKSNNVQRRQPRVTFEVSKRNYNRWRYGTHTLERVLRLSGHSIEVSFVGKDQKVRTASVLLNNRLIPLSAIELTPRHKPNFVPAQVAEASALPN